MMKHQIKIKIEIQKNPQKVGSKKQKQCTCIYKLALPIALIRPAT